MVFTNNTLILNNCEIIMKELSKNVKYIATIIGAIAVIVIIIISWLMIKDLENISADSGSIQMFSIIFLALIIGAVFVYIYAVFLLFNKKKLY